MNTDCRMEGLLYFKLRGKKWYILCTVGAVWVILMFSNFEDHSHGVDLGQKNGVGKGLFVAKQIDYNTKDSSGRKNSSGLSIIRVTKFHSDMTTANSAEIPKKMLKMETERPIDHTTSLPLRQPELVDVKEYIKMVKKKADKKETIIIITVDYSFVDMAINFYQTSLKKFGLMNYLFVCSHKKAKETLIRHRIDAVQLWNDTEGTKPSDFATSAFNRKTRYKTMAATLALDMGYTVLIVDVDIIFLMDPTPFLHCNKCEIIMQSDGSEYYRNTGFYLAYPTKNVIKLHHMVLNAYRMSAQSNDQQSFNAALQYLESQGKFNVKVLDLKLFPNGDTYFDKGKRMFADDNSCNNCILIHNNYIASFSNKRYRFKEHLLWVIDKDQYYSNQSARYLTYENPWDFGPKNTLEMEEEALNTAFAIGHILQRIVILPRFYCYACPMDICKYKHLSPRCAAYVHYNMSTMDKILGNQYRENMFLSNRLVPSKFRESKTERIVITSMTTKRLLDSQNFTLKNVKNSNIFSPLNIDEGANTEALLAWLKPFEGYSVLRFHSLYGKILSSEGIMDIKYKIQKGVKSLHKKTYK